MEVVFITDQHTDKDGPRQWGVLPMAVELHARLPEIDPAQALLIMEAHQTCPYSKAMRGDAAVELVADAC
jgi:organic hydroperoxide reductase OsmC/OhrA